MIDAEDTVETVPTATADEGRSAGDEAPDAGAWVSAAGVVAAGALLSACGGGGTAPAVGPSGPGLSGVDVAAYTHTAATSDAEAARFLQHAQFSSTEAEIAAVRRGTYASWLADQINTPIGQTGWDWLEQRGYGRNDKNQFFFNDYPADYMIWQQLMSAPDAMRQRVALALSEFFVISINGSEFTWRSHAVAHWWDTLVSHAFGNFRQLLEAVTLHPAMGWYLNTKGNQKADDNGRVPDENYAREVMQLFTIGLYELHPDGTEKLDGKGDRIETYGQSDVTNLARVFTGYDFDVRAGERIRPIGADYDVESRHFAARPMAFDPDLHSPEEVRFLGATIPAGTPGPVALKAALDTLFNHPNVGPFFGRQMIQRLVTSHPSPAYVARVAAAFNNNGAGVRGDLRAVWAAVLLDDEARGPAGLTDPNFGKVRELMLRLVHWARSFGATSKAGSWKVGNLSSSEWSLGQSPLRAPSVFNYYRPGFVPPGTPLAARGVTAPEFQTINETTVGSYINHMQYVLQEGIYVSSPDALEAYPANGSWEPDIVSAYTRQLQLVNDPPALVDHLALLLCAGQLSAATRQTIVTALQAVWIDPKAPAEGRRNRVGAAIFLIMASAEYLIQK
ncbi:MAG: DUF1800 domain-containing protein [Hydrogenophaga sp.]|uniref:DUF1800 domain-containing protein n=1 Tax=Hydrogenophaga sp. TaxID=1904254 RepID=UPI003D9B3060